MRARVLAVCFAFAIGWPVPSQALDPLSLMVLRMLRDQIISAGLEAQLRAQPSRESAATDARALEQAEISAPRELRALIDEGFPHLDRTQRDAVYAKLRQALDDPQNAQSRGLMLQQFRVTATAAGQAHQAFSELTLEQKKAIAVQAAETYRDKPPEEMRQLIELLNASAVPIPRDLRDLMLAELAQDRSSATPR
ncbi:MAG TPA: hypothetical protein VIQ62_05495 [Burkholderiales bacterium]